MFYMYIGTFGSGKSYTCVAELLKYKRVYTCVPLKLPKDIEVIEYSSWEDLFNAECGAVYLDEAGMLLFSREWEKLPVGAVRKMMEHRKDHLDFYGTAQSIDFVDKAYRDVIDEVRVPSERNVIFGAFRHPERKRPDLFCPHCGDIVRFGNTGVLDKLLVRGCGFQWYGFTKQDYIRFVTGQNVAIEAVSSGFEWFRPEVLEAYSTFSKVSEHINEWNAARERALALEGRKRFMSRRH